MARPKRTLSDTLLFRLATLMLKELKSPKQIAQIIAKEFPEEKHFTRQSVYRYLPDAVKQNIIRLVPPLDVSMSEKLAAVKSFQIRTDQVHVVPTANEKENVLVAVKAAEIALERIRAKQKDLHHRRVCLGLGPGRGTRDFAEALGRLLGSDANIGKFDLYSIAAGCPARAPEYSSPSFFNLFPQGIIEEKLGMFAESMVKVREFTADFKNRHGLVEAFAARDSIDIIISSMGVLADEHDLLRGFLDPEAIRALKRRGVIGNVQYRPFTATGPLAEGADDWRAVTLFELSDFVKMVRDGHRRVILIARQCGACGMSRATALKPLLEVPELRVFSELVLDVATARDLLELAEKSQP